MDGETKRYWVQIRDQINNLRNQVVKTLNNMLKLEHPAGNYTEQTILAMINAACQYMEEIHPLGENETGNVWLARRMLQNRKRKCVRFLCKDAAMSERRTCIKKKVVTDVQFLRVRRPKIMFVVRKPKRKGKARRRFVQFLRERRPTIMFVVRKHKRKGLKQARKRRC